MARPWSDVTKSERFQALGAAEQEAARRQYFDQVVAPRVPEGSVDIARAQFDKQTRIAKQDLPEGMEPSQAGAGRGMVVPPTAPTEIEAPPPRRGTMRGVAPFVGGDERVAAPPSPQTSILEQPRADFQPSQADLIEQSKSPETQQRALEAAQARRGTGQISALPEPAAVDRAAAGVEDALGGRSIASQVAGAATRTGGDLGLSLLKAAPETIKLASDIAQLGTGGMTEGFSRFLQATSDAMGAQQSTKLREEHAALTSLMQNPDAGVGAIAAFLMTHPEYAVNAALPSAGSMLLGAGGAKLGVAAAERIAARRGIVGAELQALTGAGATAGATGANALMNAGSTFADTQGDLGDKYTAAGVAGASTALGGRLFDGGAEAALVRGAAGKSRLGAVGGTALKEGGQEAFESTGQQVGQAIGEDKPLDPNAIAKQATLEGGLGALMGAGAGAVARVAPPVESLTSYMARQPVGETLPPTKARTESIRRFDELAAQFGLNSKALARAKEQAATMPAGQVAGFLAKVTAAFDKRGLFSRPIDEDGMTELGTMMGDQAPASVSQGTEAAAPAEAQAVSNIEQILGAPVPATPQGDLAAAAEDFSGLADTPAAPASSAEMAGDPINRAWTAFTPESGSLNLPREQLPQIKAEHRGALVNFLSARGVAHEQAEVPAADLKPTQGEFSPKKVQQAREFEGGDRSILVSSDGYVLDGHHQWLAKMDAGEPVKVIRLDAPIQDLLRLAHQFPSSTTARGARPAAQPAGDPNGAKPDAGGPAGLADRPADGGGDQPAGGVEPMGELPAAGGLDGVPAAPEGTASSGEPAAPMGDGSGTDAPLSRVLTRAGRTPNTATPIELRSNADGTLTPFHEGYALADFDSGEPIVLPADVTDLAAKQAIRAAGAVSTRTNFYAPKKGKSDDANQSSAAAPEAQAAPIEAPAAAGSDGATGAAEPAAAGAADLQADGVGRKAEARGETTIGGVQFPGMVQSRRGPDEMLPPSQSTVAQASSEMSAPARSGVGVSNSLPGFDRYGAGPAEQDLAERQVEALTGVRFPVRTVDSMASGAPGRFSRSDGVVHLSSKVTFTQGGIVETLAEEFLHGVDSIGPTRALSTASQRLAPDGDIRMEVAGHHSAGGEFAPFLHYPLGDVTLNESRVRAELFARLGVMYLSNPGQMRAALPTTFEAYHAILWKRGISPDHDRLPRQVRRGHQSVDQERGDDRSDGQAGAGLPRRVEGRQSDRLADLRARVVEQFATRGDGGYYRGGLRSPDGQQTELAAALSTAPARRQPDPIRSALQSYLRKITETWANKPEVIVIDSMADAPAVVRRANEAQMQRGSSGEPAAFTHAGKVYIVARQFKSMEKAAESLFHEALGHLGLRGLFGADLNKVLRQMAASMPDALKAKAKQYGLDLSNPEQRMLAAEELLAEIAETRPTSTWVRKAITAIREWLRKHIPALADMKWSDSEIIEKVIIPARRFIEEGRGQAAHAGEPAMAFQRSETPTKSIAGGRARGKTQSVANPKDVAGNDSGSPAGDDSLGTDEATGLPLNADGTVTVYHHTSAAHAAEIRSTGRLQAAAEPDVYVTTRHETDTGYGDTAVAIRVRPSDLVIDDEFPNGRRDFRMSVGRPGASIKVDVQDEPSASVGADAKIESVAFQRAPDTDAFRRWFGDSKVVDAEGKPRVMYHGTSSSFSKFEGDKNGLIFVTPDAQFADRFASARASGHPNLMPVYVSAQRPFDHQKKVDRQALIDRLMEIHPSYTQGDGQQALLIDGRKTLYTDAVLEATLTDDSDSTWQFLETPSIVDMVERAGFDSMYVMEDGVKNLALFDSAQIKSAIGNRGTFDPSSPDILFQRTKSPEQQEALKRAGLGGPRTLRAKVSQYFGRAMDMLASRAEFADTLRQAALDQFHGINRAVKREVGNLPAEQDPYVAARLANGGTSSVMRAILLHGQAKWAENGQHLEKIEGTKGLLDIFAPLGEDLNDFFGWMIGNRAARLMREGREHNLTAEQIAALQSLADGKKPAFQAAAQQYAAFKRSVLDIAQTAGLIDPEGRKVWDQADYIPFYREIDEKATFGATGKKGLAGQSSGIRTLKGGEGALNDPMENVLMNFSRLIDASLKNNALRKTIDTLQGSEVVKKVGYDMASQAIPADQVRLLLEKAGTPPAIMDVIPAEAFAGMAKMWAIKAPQDPDVIRVMVGGKPEFYRVNDPLLLRALTSFVPFDFPGLGAMRAFKRLLTAAVTSTPEFMARNFIRDSVASNMIARDGFNPVKSLTGIMDSYLGAGGAEAMLFSGASFQSGNINAADPTGTATAMRRALRKKGLDASSADSFMASVLDTPAKFWEKYRHVGESIENANREAVFDAAKKAGKSETAAAFESKDLMDFSLRGSSPVYQVLADVLPFFNARVQGLYRLGRANPKRVLATGGLMVAATLLNAMLNADRPEYDELPDWDKDAFWHIWIRGEHFRIPKPFELGVVFATVPERIFRYAKDKDTGKKTASRLWANVRDQLAFDPVPQMFRPGINAWANKDTFRDAPIEGMADEGKLPSQRYSARTSDTAKVIVKAVAPVADATGLSPKKLEYLVGGYLGTAGLYALGLSDMGVRALQGKPPTPTMRLDDYPVVRAFYRMDPARSTVYESDLYNLRTELEEVYRSINALKREGDAAGAIAMAKDHPEVGLRQPVNDAAKLLAQLNKARDAIYADPKMSPDQKRIETDKILAKKALVARTVMTNPKVKEHQ